MNSMTPEMCGQIMRQDARAGRLLMDTTAVKGGTPAQVAAPDDRRLSSDAEIRATDLQLTTTRAVSLTDEDVASEISD